MKFNKICCCNKRLFVGHRKLIYIIILFILSFLLTRVYMGFQAPVVAEHDKNEYSKSNTRYFEQVTKMSFFLHDWDVQHTAGLQEDWIRVLKIYLKKKGIDTEILSDPDLEQDEVAPQIDLREKSRLIKTGADSDSKSDTAAADSRNTRPDIENTNSGKSAVNPAPVKPHFFSFNPNPKTNPDLDTDSSQTENFDTQGAKEGKEFAVLFDIYARREYQRTIAFHRQTVAAPESNGRIKPWVAAITEWTRILSLNNFASDNFDNNASGNKQSKPNIPNIIWLYLPAIETPQRIAWIKNLRYLHPDHKIYIITPTTLPLIVDFDLPPNWTSLSAVDKTGWIMLACLWQGGTWLDTTVMLLQNIDKIVVGGKWVGDSDIKLFYDDVLTLWPGIPAFQTFIVSAGGASYLDHLVLTYGKKVATRVFTASYRSGGVDRTLATLQKIVQLDGGRIETTSMYGPGRSVFVGEDDLMRFMVKEYKFKDKGVGPLSFLVVSETKMKEIWARASKSRWGDWFNWGVVHRASLWCVFMRDARGCGGKGSDYLEVRSASEM